MIRDLTVADGRVTFTFLLSRDDPATLVRQARNALRAIDGVNEVKITVVDPAGSKGPTHGPPAGAMPQSTGMPAPPGPGEVSPLCRGLAISSGKGGGGKGTVAANAAVALGQNGRRGGLLD